MSDSSNPLPHFVENGRAAAVAEHGKPGVTVFQAAPLLEVSLKTRKELMPANDPIIAYSLNQLAVVYSKHGNRGQNTGIGDTVLVIRSKPTTLHRWLCRVAAVATVLTQALAESGGDTAAVAADLTPQCSRGDLVEVLARGGAKWRSAAKWGSWRTG